MQDTVFVGGPTCYGLDGPGIESRWTRFSPPVQTDPGTHPASHTMGTQSLQGVKRPGLGVNYPPPSSAEIKEIVELYLYSPSGPSCPVIGWTVTLHLLYTFFYVLSVRALRSFDSILIINRTCFKWQPVESIAFHWLMFLTGSVCVFLHVSPVDKGSLLCFLGQLYTPEQRSIVCSWSTGIMSNYGVADWQ